MTRWIAVLMAALMLGLAPTLAQEPAPAVVEDVDARTEAGDILRAARGADKKLIAAASVFDVFEGPTADEQFGAGKKSVAISVSLQPTEKTLTDEEIEGVAERVVAAVQKAVGAELRG